MKEWRRGIEEGAAAEKSSKEGHFQIYNMNSLKIYLRENLGLWSRRRGWLSSIR